MFLSLHVKLFSVTLAGSAVAGPLLAFKLTSLEIPERTLFLSDLGDYEKDCRFLTSLSAGGDADNKHVLICKNPNKFQNGLRAYLYEGKTAPLKRIKSLTFSDLKITLKYHNTEDVIFTETLNITQNQNWERLNDVQLEEKCSISQEYRRMTCEGVPESNYWVLQKLGSDFKLN